MNDSATPLPPPPAPAARQAPPAPARAASLLQRSGAALGLNLRRAGAALSNGRRHLVRRRLPDYVSFSLAHPLRELAADSPWYVRWFAPTAMPASLQGLAARLRRVAEEPAVRGLLLIVKSAPLSRSTAQSLALLLARFRSWDSAANPHGAAGAQGAAGVHGAAGAHGAPKRIVVWLEQMSAEHAVAFAAADTLYLAPQGGWDVTGLRVEKTYLHDTLARIGVQAEVVKVAPWKTAADTISEAQMSDAEREQYGWLLDSLFAQIVEAIAAGRGLPADDVRAAIDRAPLTAEEALAAGLIDGICYEDELAARLAPAPATPMPAAGETAPVARPARLARYSTVEGILYRSVRPRSRAIGLLSLEGSIVSGASRSFPLPLPLLGGEMVGSTTVQQAVRAARRSPQLAALVVHIDSPGGSATASDLIWRELALLAQEKPLVIYMGDVAASGGYYVAMPGHHIVAQQATLTGSIGVILAKVVTAGAYAQLDAQRDVVQRGANAGLLSDAEPWTPPQRARMEALVADTYTAFLARVQQGRGLDADQLQALAGGRVWTGAQALAHGLIDSVGDLTCAVEEAARLAGLPTGAEHLLERVHAGHALAATPAAPHPAGWMAAALLRALAAPAGAPASAPAALVAAQFGAAAAEGRRLLRSERLWLLAERLPENEQ